MRRSFGCLQHRLDMPAACHQRLDAGAEILDALDEVVEGQEHAAGAGDGWHFVEQLATVSYEPTSVPMLILTAETGSAIWRILVSAPDLVSAAPLNAEPGDRLLIGTGLVMLPLGGRASVRLVGDHHEEHEGGDVTAGPGGGGLQAFGGGREGLGRIDADAEAEIVVGISRGRIPCRHSTNRRR